MKLLSLGFLTAFVVVGLAALMFLEFGGMPVRTKGPPLPLERWVARTALHAAFRGKIDQPSPLPANEENLAAGVHIYSQHCAVCHGVPEGKPTAIARGLFPKPPQLFSHGVDDDPIGETFWKVKNGIRLTGMPGFEDSLTDDEIWQVSLLLAQGKKISLDLQTKLRAEPTSGAQE